MWVWFVMRGTGIVLTALLTLSVVIGVLSTVRAGSSRWPRFATQAIHRNVSLLAFAFLMVHALAAVVHHFVDIRWYDMFVPIGGDYVAKERPAMALAALSMDLTIAVIVTSLLRARLPHRAWRAIHLSSYLAWGAGVLHGFLIGTDSKTEWSMVITLSSVIAVAVALVVRLWTAAHEIRRESLALKG